MTMSKKRNPMQATAIDLAGVRVNIEIKNGATQLGLDVASTEAYEVVNELETTNFINLENLPDDARERKVIYTALLSRLESANGKHYIVINPAYSAELIAYINERKPDYTDKLAKGTNLLVTHLDKLPKLHGLTNEYKIDILDNTESKDNLEERCAKIAKFQKDRLIAMRPSLPDEAAHKKMDERYSEEALIKKAQSGRIIVFSVKKDKDIIATLVVNLHAAQNKSLSDNIVYVSDIIIEKGFINDEQFVTQFMMSAFHQLTKLLPQTKILTFMAPGDAKDPLVSCVSKAKEQGLFVTLDKSEQTKLGLVAYFVNLPENKPKLNLSDMPASLFNYKVTLADKKMVTVKTEEIKLEVSESKTFLN